MTSLVVVMNNKAAAVAADSAMTVADGLGNTRTRTGVRKLFPISEAQPVSLMIYGSAEIMEMAWGPFIVNYRRQRGDRVFDTVQDYAADFLDYLDNYDGIFDAGSQDRAFEHYVNVMYDWVRYNANHIVDRENEDPTPEGPRTMRDVMRQATELVYQDVTHYPDESPRDVLDGFSDSFGEGLLREFGDRIDGLIKEFFGEVDMDRETVRRLRAIAHLSVTRDFFPDFFPNTGLVFTGYGAKQITPQLSAHLVGIAVNGQLRQRQSSLRTINSEDPVIIAPFAQDKMIHTFLTGMDQELSDYLQDQIIDLSIGVRDRTIAQMPELNRSQRRRFSESYSDDDIVELINDFIGRLDQYQYEVHTHPILLAVESLPERELAQTAEMLVKLNAFQQQVGNTLETVGGDIDVALMTNEEFRWVKKADA